MEEEQGLTPLEAGRSPCAAVECMEATASGSVVAHAREPSARMEQSVLASISADDQRCISEAELLLASRGSKAEQWEGASPDHLLLEIQKYRRCLADMEARLNSMEQLQQNHAEAQASMDTGTEAELLQGSELATGTGLREDSHEQAAGPAAVAAAADSTGLGCSSRGGSAGGACPEVCSVDDLDPREWQVPPHCIPIHANVTTYNWRGLYDHTQFDVIMMDPPWQLATANPTRGVSLGYSQLTDNDIANLPVPQLQSNGFLFIWVINAKYTWTLDLFEKWGYTMVDEIVWCKMTVNRRLAKSHGYYLQHAKEVCLVGKRGLDPPGMSHRGVCSDVIFSERRGQSQKPEEVYELIEELVPQGRYLEIFARKNNLRNFWVSIGNEVTGTGLPEEDMNALKERACIPNAVYGRASTRTAAAS